MTWRHRSTWHAPATTTSHSRLRAWQTDAAARTPQPEIHLVPDRLARYDAVAKILADAQRLGVSRIGIVGTDKYLR